MSIILGSHSPDQVQEQVFVKVVIAGDGCVGKTSLRLQYLGEYVPRTYVATIGADYAIKSLVLDTVEIKIGIFDLAGQPDYMNVRSLFYWDTRGCLLVYDRTRPGSLTNLHLWWNELKKNSQIDELYVTVIGNKSDLESKIRIEEGERFAREIDAPHYITSALTGENVENVFNSMVIKIWKCISQAF
ncbi:MAG: GTP-binding protein [Promethearchaeota archaeon]